MAPSPVVWRPALERRPRDPLVRELFGPLLEQRQLQPLAAIAALGQLVAHENLVARIAKVVVPLLRILAGAEELFLHVDPPGAPRGQHPLHAKVRLRLLAEVGSTGVDDGGVAGGQARPLAWT